MKQEMLNSLDTFTTQYLETALWSSTDDDDRPLNENYGLEDISLAALQEAIAECQSFQSDHFDLIKSDLSRAGHDFWLTRNRHGTGFWDGDWGPEVGAILTDAAHIWGSIHLSVGDDGQIYS